MKRSADLRVQKTRDAIRSTFKDMVMEMGASEITVKELAERARIHRKTFYLHYSCIEALYEELFSEHAERFFAALDGASGGTDFLTFNRVFFEFMAGQEPYLEKIICDLSYRENADRFFLFLIRSNLSRFKPFAAYPRTARNIIVSFLSTGMVELYRRWVADGKELPVGELIALSGQLFLHGVSSVSEGGKQA